MQIVSDNQLHLLSGDTEMTVFINGVLHFTYVCKSVIQCCQSLLGTILLACRDGLLRLVSYSTSDPQFTEIDIHLPMQSFGCITAMSVNNISDNNICIWLGDNSGRLYLIEIEKSDKTSSRVIYQHTGSNYGRIESIVSVDRDTIVVQHSQTSFSVIHFQVIQMLFIC